MDKLEDHARDDEEVRKQLRELLQANDPEARQLCARVRSALAYWFMDEADLQVPYPHPPPPSPRPVWTLHSSQPTLVRVGGALLTQIF